MTFTVLRDYEAVFAVSPESGEEALSKIRTQFSELVGRHGGRVLDSVVLGKRKLSYPVGRWGEGVYLHAKLQLPSAEVAALEKAAKTMETTIRFMLTTASGLPTNPPHGLESGPQRVESRGPEPAGA